MSDTTQQSDSRAAVEAAMQQHEQAGEVVAPTSAISSSPPETPVAEPTPADAPERARDEGGRFAPKPKEERPAAAEQKKPEPQDAIGAVAEEKPAEQPRAGAPKSAPLPSAVREEWDRVPEATRQYILKREGEAARLMSETAAARKTHGALTKALEPYRDIITTEPMQAIGNLLQTAAILKRGQPREKAHLAAQMIAGYGIDIEQLAGFLEQAPASAPAPYRDPRVDDLERRLARDEAERWRGHQATAAKQYKEFAAGADLLDRPGVREAMEREMVHAASSGVELGLQEAYDRVVWALPETRGEMLERERQRASIGTATDKAAIQRAKHAASSVKTDPSLGRVTTDNSVEALIRAQLDGAR